MAVDKKLSEIIFNSISDGVFTVDKTCRITSFNKAAEEITGFKVENAIGKYCFDIFRTELCNKKCALKDTLKNETNIENARVTIISQRGCEIPISVTTELLKDENGKPIGAVEFFRDISELEYLRKHNFQKKNLNKIVSVNNQMQKLIKLLPQVAGSDSNVLIQGPSGSGKELIASTLHNLSPRKYDPYVRINCAALPAQLLESELFGYKKGAFTDAKRDKSGHFCLADGGTILLDEISEMDVSLQAKLLRVLNNGEYSPLGSSVTYHSDARIISSTNADLKEEIKKGRFREDLYYRINVVELKVPSLSERPEDIPLLANHFVKENNLKKRLHIDKIAPEALAILRKYNFPGNVRELENAIEHSFVMCRGAEILPEHLPNHILQAIKVNNQPKSNGGSEKNIIIEALDRNGGNKSRTAVELGMHRTTLWRKMKEHDLVH